MIVEVKMFITVDLDYMQVSVYRTDFIICKPFPSLREMSQGKFCAAFYCDGLFMPFFRENGGF